MALALLAGALIGVVYATLFNRFGMPSFVATLAGLLAFLGLQLLLLGKEGSINLPFDSFLVKLGQLYFMPVWAAYAVALVARGRLLRHQCPAGPAPARGRPLGAVDRLPRRALGGAPGRAAVRGLVPQPRPRRAVDVPVFALLVLALHYGLTRHPLGTLSVTAVGGNREAARRAGINVKRIYLSCFVLCSTLAALAACSARPGWPPPARRPAPAMSTSTRSRRRSSAAPASSADAARRSPLLGIIVIQSISNGLTLLDLSSALRFMITAPSSPSPSWSTPWPGARAPPTVPHERPHGAVRRRPVHPRRGVRRGVAERLGSDVETRVLDSAWPDDPFRAVDGVREAAGEVEALVQAVGDAEVLRTPPGPGQPCGPRGRPLAPGRRGHPGRTGQRGPARRRGARGPRGVPPGRNLSAVAEFTVGVMIALPRGIATAAATLSRGEWDSRWFPLRRDRPRALRLHRRPGRGGGRGLRVAELLRAFGSEVLAHDPYADEQTLRSRGIEPVGLDDLLARSDVVSLHARLTDDTRHLVDATTLGKMKPGAYLVNTARGELVDQEAVRAALEEGRLGGLATDVFDPEPPDPGDPLLGRPDVLPTPHLAGSSRQVASLSVRRVVDEVARFLEDGTLEHCANPRWESNRRSS